MSFNFVEFKIPTITTDVHNIALEYSLVWCENFLITSKFYSDSHSYYFVRSE